MLALRTMLAALVVLCLQAAAFSAPADAPRIGLVYSRAEGDKLAQGKDPLLAYRRSLEAAGALVVAVVVPTPGGDPLVPALDGLLLPGGRDLDPKTYGSKPSKWLESTDDSLDQLELQLVAAFTKSKRPILGICRGEQVLNVALGGTLYQDLPHERGVIDGVSHRGTATAPAAHRVHIGPGTQLYALIGAEYVVTNSYHHQAAKKLGNGMKKTATAADGVVEGIEGPNLLAVQFHPEKMRQSDPRFEKIFVWLVEQARKHRDAAQKS